MTKLSVRQAHLGDASDLVAIHCSHVHEWTRRSGQGGKEAASYQDLSLSDRFRHGGPWMSVETCSVHVNNMLTSGHPMFVAEWGGRVAGTAELFTGEEPQPFGRIAHLSVLCVHGRYTMRGIGSALMHEVALTAARRGCERLSTVPDKGAEGFYRRHGMKPWILQRCVSVDVPRLGGRVVPRRIGMTEYPGRTLAMRIGRFQSSRQNWDQATWPPYGLPGLMPPDPVVQIRHAKGDVLLHLSRVFGRPGTVRPMVWASPSVATSDLARMSLGQCAEMGHRRAEFLVDEEETRQLATQWAGKTTLTWRHWMTEL